MTDPKNPGDKTLTVSPPKTLTLKRPVEQNTVKQSFSHGRSKSVVVEVKRRISGPSDLSHQGAVQPRPASPPPAAAAPVPASVPAAAPPAAPAKPAASMVLRTLSATRPFAAWLTKGLPPRVRRCPAHRPQRLRVRMAVRSAWMDARHASTFRAPRARTARSVPKAIARLCAPTRRARMVVSAARAPKAARHVPIPVIAVHALTLRVPRVAIAVLGPKAQAHALKAAAIAARAPMAALRVLKVASAPAPTVMGHAVRVLLADSGLLPGLACCGPALAKHRRSI